jgi:hypothetical protein
MIAIPEQYRRAETGFPIFVGILSVINLYTELFSSDGFINIFSIGISITGLAAVFLYFDNNKTYSLLFRIWAVSQTFLLVLYLPNETNTFLTKVPLWKTEQVFELCFYFDLEFHNSSHLEIGINFLGIIYTGIAQLIHLTSLFNTQINLKPLKEDSFLNNYLPSAATFVKRVTLSEEKDWLLVKLDQKDDKKEYEYALIKPKDGTGFSVKKKQVLNFLLVKDLNSIKEKNNRDEFKTGDWAIIDFKFKV